MTASADHTRIANAFGFATVEEMHAAEAEKGREAADIAERDGIPFLSAYIIAGDRATARRAWAMLEAGEPYERCEAQVGSYARLDFALRATEAGFRPRADLLAALPELWRGSDPDDTDPRFLALWREAHRANGSAYVRDGRPLPRGQALRIFRGQMPDAPYGIAWTLDPKIARKFARGAGLRTATMPGTIIRADVPRRAVLAYLTERGESEVILDPAPLTVPQASHVRP